MLLGVLLVVITLAYNQYRSMRKRLSGRIDPSSNITLGLLERKQTSVCGPKKIQVEYVTLGWYYYGEGLVGLPVQTETEKMARVYLLEVCQLGSLLAREVLWPIGRRYPTEI
jgi:hypothetical protein